MKLKKGDVYKEKKGSRWFKVIFHKKNYFWTVYSEGGYGRYYAHNSAFTNDIRTGKLIKIPQLYK